MRVGTQFHEPSPERKRKGEENKTLYSTLNEKGSQCSVKGWNGRMDGPALGHVERITGGRERAKERSQVSLSVFPLVSTLANRKGAREPFLSLCICSQLFPTGRRKSLLDLFVLVGQKTHYYAREHIWDKGRWMDLQTLNEEEQGSRRTKENNGGSEELRSIMLSLFSFFLVHYPTTFLEHAMTAGRMDTSILPK